MGLNPLESIKNTVNTVKTTANSIKNRVEKIPADVAEKTRDIGTIVSGEVEKVSTTVRTEVGNVTSKIESEVKKVISGATSGASALTGQFEELGSTLDELPEWVVEKIKKEAEELGMDATKLLEQFIRVLKVVQKDVIDTCDFIVNAVESVGGELSKFKGSGSNSFKKHLTQFLTVDIPAWSGHLQRLGAPRLAPDLSPLASMIEALPPVLLLPISQVFKAVPNWKTLPGKVTEGLALLQSPEVKRRKRAFSDEIKVTVRSMSTPESMLLASQIKINCGVIQSSVQAISDVLPDTYTLGGDILGEGGAVTIPLKPMKAGFVLIKYICDILTTMIDSWINVETYLKAAED